MFFYKKDQRGKIKMFCKADAPLGFTENGWESTEDEIIQLHDGSLAFKKDIDMKEEQAAVEKKNKQASIDEEINKLKSELEKTDYKCLKYVDGDLSNEEYKEVKEHRNKLRRKINELEAML